MAESIFEQARSKLVILSAIGMYGAKTQSRQDKFFECVDFINDALKEAESMREKQKYEAS